MDGNISDSIDTPITPITKAKPSLLKTFLAGGVGGTCLVFVGHPLDTIKVRIQTMEIIKGVAPPYSGTFDCMKKTVKSEGVRGLYKGMAAPIVGVTPMYALCFFGYGIGQKIFTTEDTYKNMNTENLVRIGLAGATSGIFTTPILGPGERIKCVLQVQKSLDGKSRYSGPMDCAKQLYKEGGLRSVFRGSMATMARDSLASAFYFSTYELLKQKLTPVGESSPGIGGTLLAGGTAGILNWAVALPIDTMKSRLQVAADGKYPHGMRSVFADIYRHDGLLSLYRGFSAVMLRAFPANAACFLGYETAITVLDYIGLP